MSNTLFVQAVRQHRGGNLCEAERLYQRVLQADPQDSGAWHYLGLIAYQQGAHEKATRLIEQALAIDPEDALAHNHLGLVLGARGRSQEALEAYRRALQLRPAYADALSNLGSLWRDRGDVEQALACYRRALQTEPRHVNALYNCANALAQCGRSEEAIRYYEQAVQLAPRCPELHNNLANAYLARRRFTQATAAYRTAVALRCDYAEAHYNLGTALAEQQQPAEASASFERAARLRPDKLWWQLRSELLWPPVFQSNQEIDRYRTRLEETLDRFLHNGLRLDWSEIAACGCIPPFSLAHQGRIDVALRSKLAALLAPSFAEYNSRFDHAVSVQSGGRRRIGVVVTRGHEPLWLRCMAGILNGLSVGRFEILLVCARSALPGIRRVINHPDVTMVPLSESFSDAVETIRALQCHVLYYWEIGSDALNYSLPFVRLAPVQCTSWGTLVTTGIGQVDYYLSSGLVETAEADENYSERLVRLDSLLSCQPPTQVPFPPKDRKAFSLPEGKTLYMCLQNLAKFHPDFDTLLAEILRRDPRGLVVLKQTRWPLAGELLLERLRRTVPDVVNRIVFVPWQSERDYLRLLSMADVVLDTVHYGSGSTCYEIFSLGLPLVTWPGALNVGRYAWGCYQKMALPELVAWSGREYVDLAVRLGTDIHWRTSIKARISAASEVLFQDQETVHEHERFFVEAC